MFKNKENMFAPLRDLHVMTSAALLSAIAIILGFFKIPVTQLIEIRFSMLPIALSGCLFGPVVGGAVGMISDIGGYLVKPTGPFFPGFTITSMVSGVIFGCFLYRQKPGISRILMSQIVYTIVCGILLNSIWLSILYGNGFVAVIGARFVKEMVMIPINTIMLATIIEPVKRYRRAAS
jgi:ECF transporter S component (folate family)